MTTLKNQITEVLKAAMRAKEMSKLTVIRGLQAAIKQIEIDERIELDDTQVLAVIEKQIKLINTSQICVYPNTHLKVRLNLFNLSLQYYSVKC